MIHLSAPRMNGLPQRMGFIQNLLLESFSPWQNKPFLEPQGLFRILVVTSDLWVTFSHSSLNMPLAFVILLSSYDLRPQDWHEGDVEQCQVR
jgi:hypothetical protein